MEAVQDAGHAHRAVSSGARGVRERAGVVTAGPDGESGG